VINVTCQAAIFKCVVAFGQKAVKCAYRRKFNNSFCLQGCLRKQKPRRSGVLLKKLKLTDKPGSFKHTSGICGAGIVLCHRLYLSLYVTDKTG